MDHGIGPALFVLYRILLVLPAVSQSQKKVSKGQPLKRPGRATVASSRGCFAHVFGLGEGGEGGGGGGKIGRVLLPRMGVLGGNTF